MVSYVHFDMDVARFSRALFFLPYHLTNNLDIRGIARFPLCLLCSQITRPLRHPCE